jgi:alpha-ketoglutarate-dependent taurine dioxygenase
MASSSNPFDLSDDNTYQAWRMRKLAAYPLGLETLRIDIKNPFQLSEVEHAAILRNCRDFNMSLYRFRGGDNSKEAILALGKQFGLARLDHNLCAEEDGIAALQVAEGGRSQEYIPYSDKPINWHTDGYYNSLSQQIHGMILHCARPALEGGDNACLDHDIAYILMRDENPDYIAALMAADVMSIPPNYENGIEIRSRQTGPVFMLEADGNLHMRYTARARNIDWKKDALVTQALEFLRALYETDSDYIVRYRFSTGEGLICNNVLHNRSGFHNGATEAEQRLFYRARFYDRIA